MPELWWYWKVKMRIVTAKEMRELDQDATKRLGVAELVLMENAGAQVAAQLCEVMGDKLWQEGCRVVIFCGPGKNGADGLVAARHLVLAGIEPQVVLVGDGKTSVALSKQLHVWQTMGFNSTKIKNVKQLKT